MIRAQDMQVYTICVDFPDVTILQSASALVVGALNFQLVNLDLDAYYETIFDSYRFDEIEITFLPATAMTSTANASPLYTVVDYNDGSNLGSVSQARSYGNVAQTISQITVRRFKPHVNLAAGGAAAAAPVPSPWLDASTADTVPHFGVKYLVPPNASVQSTWLVTIRARISFRNTI